ncbi:hypothetical protein PENTCL1PPCAC_12302, partial [Pristionchus entomophagus]
EEKEKKEEIEDMGNEKVEDEDEDDESGDSDEEDEVMVLDDDEQEDPEDYTIGGYHPVSIGDVFNGKYRVICKLGFGVFSTVWLCKETDKKRRIALKIVKSAENYTQSANDEITILQCIRGADSA